MKSEIFSTLNINFALARRHGSAKRELQNTKLLVTAKRQLRLASRATAPRGAIDTAYTLREQTLREC